MGGVTILLKLLTPSRVQAILDYVFKRNVLDEQVESIQERMTKLTKRVEALEK